MQTTNEERFTPNREWWAQQWLEILDSYRFKKRLERARNYARQGNVLDIWFKERKVKADVQGTQPNPYRVSISLKPFADEEWDWVVETLANRPIFAAKLLAGEMPPSIETEVFAANGLRLFPFNLSEVRSKCTCPDKANPCKHIAAVYYLLGDRFSEDPFVLFQLRGRTKDQILDALRQYWIWQEEHTDTEPPSPETAPASTENETEEATQPAAWDATADWLSSFWEYDQQLDSSLVVIAPPASNETVLDVLGDLHFPNEDPNIPLNPAAGKIFKNYLQEIYQQVSQEAIAASLGNGDADRAEE
ncbi:SWIM zinc finger family protein [Geitlerinema sp. PCC 9228]|jgi:uncharacterized Zn finger protein|uniref:SWIM zinc finger family protein n=1 Tax=Geitlerinema sp. PCC 9228 TaxID=111611 RepID=UPI0008F99E1F|nr:SWIM zinc finger family protein [Geitlerinema sp. PCC 9228]